MLRISQKQLEVFRTALEESREERLYRHACAVYPDHLRIFGPECNRTLVRLAIETAARHSLVSDKAHRLILRLILECGAGFDADPVLQFPGPILACNSTERERIAQLAAAADLYSAKTAPGMRSAARNFRVFRTVWPDRVSLEQYLREIRSCCAALFPEKAALVPDTAWPMLVQTATAAASERAWRSVTTHAVLCGLFFLAGRGLFGDARFAFVSAMAPEPSVDPGIALHQIAVKHFERWFSHTG